MKTYKSEQNADLEFQFPDSIPIEELDKQGVTLPPMKLADFYIIRPDDILLIEVKDPSNAHSPARERDRYLSRIHGDLITKELTPKARDSYTYLHLMKKDSKPFKYIVLIGIDAYNPDEQRAIMQSFKDRLLSKIRQESYEPWKRDYIEDCFVMSIDTWNQKFPDWRVHRLSALTP